jgi:hypothetical protein
MNCFSFAENKNPQKVVQATTVSAKVFGIKVDETKNVGKNALRAKVNTSKLTLKN